MHVAVTVQLPLTRVNGGGVAGGSGGGGGGDGGAGGSGGGGRDGDGKQICHPVKAKVASDVHVMSTAGSTTVPLGPPVPPQYFEFDESPAAARSCLDSTHKKA